MPLMQGDKDRALLNLQRRLERQFFDGSRLDAATKHWVVQVYESVVEVVGHSAAVTAAFDVISALNTGAPPLPPPRLARAPFTTAFVHKSLQTFKIHATPCCSRPSHAILIREPIFAPTSPAAAAAAAAAAKRRLSATTLQLQSGWRACCRCRVHAALSPPHSRCLQP